MGKVAMIGSFTCKVGREAEMEQVLSAMTEAARGEPGVEQYGYFRADEGRYWFFALMADEESSRSHGRTPAMQEAMTAFGPLVDQPPQIAMTTPLTAVGMTM